MARVLSGPTLRLSPSHVVTILFILARRNPKSGLSPNQGTFTLELSYPSAQVNKSVVSAIPPLGHKENQDLFASSPLSIKPNSIFMAPDFQRTYNPTYSSLVWCTYQVFLLNTFVQYVDVFGIFIPILFREHPRVKRNSSTARLLHVSAVSGVGVDQGASHPVQTIVFTHTGEPHKMEMVVISYDPQGCRLVSQSVPVLYLRIHFYIYCAPI